MKELNKVDRFGYITQGLDLTIRARTINNEIICLYVTPEGTLGTCKGETVELPEIIKKIDRIIYLIQILKVSQIILKRGKVTIIPFNKSKAVTKRSPNNSENCGENAIICAGEGCAQEGCGENAIVCAEKGCASDSCLQNAVVCAGNVCTGDGCASHGDICSGDGCIGDGCGGHDGGCIGNGCIGVGCGIEGEACAAHGCVGFGCAIDAGGCAAEGHIGPCALHIPYCPIIF